MGAVEDSRKVLQDFLAPELREIKVRLDVLEKRVDGVDRKIDVLDMKVDKLGESLNGRVDLVGASLNDKIESVSASLNGKIEGLAEKVELLDRRSEQRHDVVMMALNRLTDYTEVLQRLARLEGQRAPQ